MHPHDALQHVDEPAPNIPPSAVQSFGAAVVGGQLCGDVRSLDREGGVDNR